jgi:ABC-type sugar transport system ATPase subunit
VLANLAAEIAALTVVAEAMQRRLSQLDPAQRAEVEEASRILRRPAPLAPCR